MREIKFEYVYKNKETGVIKRAIKLLNELDIKGNTFIHTIWDLIDRRQYTGLKDKNGAEIYEGDILKKSVSEYDLVKVYFANGMFICESVSESRITGTTHWKQFHSLFYDEYHKYNNYEVIGNIYENSDLLKC